jgi:chromosome segregation ATPase
VSEAEIRQQIRHYEALLRQAHQCLADRRREREDLQTFRSRHEAATHRLLSDAQQRRAQLSETGLNESRVRVFAGYKKAMLGLLEQGDQHVKRSQDQHRQIVIAMERVEDEIEGARRDISRCENRLATLRAQLYATQNAA